LNLESVVCLKNS